MIVANLIILCRRELNKKNLISFVSLFFKWIDYTLLKLYSKGTKVIMLFSSACNSTQSTIPFSNFF